MRSPNDLTRALAARLGCPVHLVWTANRSVYLSLRPGRRGCALRLHRCFEGAPEDVWRGLEAFLRTGAREHLEPARTYFSAFRSPVPPRAPVLRPVGRVHDLSALFEEALGRKPFADLPRVVPVGVTWGRRTRPGRSHVRLGSYRAGPPALIRVHPVLDDSRVPAIVVGQVLHHELVHHYLGHVAGGREGRSHGPRFRALEECYPGAEVVREWEQRYLPGLLAEARRR